MSPRTGFVAPTLVVAVVAAVLLQPGCGRMTPSSPYERHVAELRASGLDQSPAGRDWVAAGDAALRQAVAAPAPFRAAGQLSATTPQAVAWRWTLSRGRRLSVAATFEPATAGRLFVDLFALDADGTTRRVAWLEPGRTSLVHEIERDGTYAVRLQPELRHGGRFAVAQRTLSGLRFPLAGDAEGPRSPFGAARDAGARRHEGVDIFAPRGTPVVAVAGGLARRGTNRLGGNVVWLHEPFGGRTFYYAHLDGWAIGTYSWVRPGDVLGYVGTSGNAQRTPPHLHFGIYEQGAVDPWPFVRPDDALPGRISGR